MKIKAKQVFLVGAFIVLTVIGYFLLPRNEIVLDLHSNTEIDNENFESENQLLESGSRKKENIIYVHIEGAINSPGIKEVPVGTRLFELIDLADGALDDADLSKINLASILKDEQKVYVPYKIVINETITNSTSQNSVLLNSSNLNSDVSSNNYYIDLININTADIEELQKLAGIGPSMAKKIIDYREQKGYFNSIEDVKNVSGIGEAKYNKIKDNITI